jgi:hypothetical protein
MPPEMSLLCHFMKQQLSKLKREADCSGLKTSLINADCWSLCKLHCYIRE